MREGTMGAHPLDKDDYDWAEAFAYAGKDTDGTCVHYQNGPDVRRAHPGAETSLDPFGRDDVAEVEAYEEGENDGAEWVCLGRLKDGRWFYLSAGCDYTGWDCRAGGTATVATTRAELLQYGMTDWEKERLHVA